MQLTKGQIFAIFAAVFLAVLLFFAPTKPPLKSNPANDVENKLSLAVAYVQQGKEPMKGIAVLKEILEKDSNNIRANFYLGIFSAQSNQWEKAKIRFEKVLALDSTYSEAYNYLAQVFSNLGDSTESKKYSDKYNSLVKNLSEK